MGIIFALLTSLSWSIGIFPFTKASKIFGAQALNLSRLLLASIILFMLVIFVANINVTEVFTNPSSSQWLWLGISGIVGLSLGDYFGFTSFAILGAGRASIYTTLAPMAALLSGMMLADESLNFIGIIGMLTTIVGVYIFTYQKTEPAKEKINLKGVSFGVLSALCQGLGLTFAKIGMNSSVYELHPIHATWIRIFIAVIILFVITIVSGTLVKDYRSIAENKPGFKYIILGTLFGPVIGVSLSLTTVKLLEVSVAQTIFSLVPIIVNLIAVIFFKEKLSFKNVVGLLVTIVGVMVLVWRDRLMGMF